MNTRELAQAVKRLVSADAEAYYPGQALVDWLKTAGEADLWRINAFSLADVLSADRQRLVSTLFRLVQEGVLALNWDFHCTTCNAVAGSHRHLKDATAEDHCPLCNLDFRNDLARNVEVTFSPVERLYAVGPKFLARQMELLKEAHREKRIKLPERFVSGIDCLHIPLFRDLFETETLSLRESLQVGHVCIMFTDIKGSTALYDRLGDSIAYALVRDHFEILFREVEAKGGVIVKTIGDSVMASFKRPVDGVAAALAIRAAFEAFNRREDLRSELLVKVGLHSGNTIAVNLNNRLDYFGQTVNMAARIQGMAEGGEVVISSAIRNDPPSLQAMRGKVLTFTKRLASLKGISERQEVFRLNFAAEARL